MVFTTFRARRCGNGSPPPPYNFTRRVLGYSGQLLLRKRCIRLTRTATPSMRRFSTRPERRSPRNSYPPDAKSEANTLDRHAKTGNFPQAECRHFDTLGYFDTVLRHQETTSLVVNRKSRVSVTYRLLHCAGTILALFNAKRTR
jgi:hypothetical protein